MIAAVVNWLMPICPHCDGKGGGMSGYYEPEWRMECDIEMRDLAVEALQSLGKDPARELQMHLRAKKLANKPRRKPQAKGSP